MDPRWRVLENRVRLALKHIRQDAREPGLPKAVRQVLDRSARRISRALTIPLPLPPEKP